MNRREALQRLAWTSAAALLSPLLEGCWSAHPPRLGSPARPDVRVDDSFARQLLEAAHDDLDRLRPRLLAHPALAAMVRHQRIAGNAAAVPEAVLDRILASLRRARPTALVLESWRTRERELADAVHAAELYLPPGSTFTGTVYFVVGYDIGVAAPPDIVLNAGHEHFCSAPSEVAPYATHEAHHVGFLGLRPPPAMRELNEPARLREVIAYMTQLEGMGVQAAYPPRRERGLLDADGDYRVYTDPAEAKRITARYAQLVEPLARGARLADGEVGTILNAMSSGERAWYRFGALAAWTLERGNGRRALVESIANPEPFNRTAAELLASAA